MPDYKVVAQTEKGKQIRIRLNASDERELKKKLSDKNQTLLYYDEIAKAVALKPLKKSQLSDFCRQIGELIKSGISILRALEIQGGDESITAYEKELYMRFRGILGRKKTTKNDLYKEYSHMKRSDFDKWIRRIQYRIDKYIERNWVNYY